MCEDSVNQKQISTAENFPLGTFRGEIVQFGNLWTPFHLQKGSIPPKMRLTIRVKQVQLEYFALFECAQRRCLWTPRAFCKKLDQKLHYFSGEVLRQADAISACL